MDVILLHGIWTRGWELYLLKRRLERAGLRASIFSYPSISKSFSENVQNLARFIEASGAKRVSLVGHSYGGLIVCGLVRAMAEGSIKTDVSIEKCIFIGSPLQGSSLARRLSNLLIVKMVTGKSLSCLKRGCTIPAGIVQTAMIAGVLNLGLGMFFIKGPGDGMVALADTQAPWINHHFVVCASHLGLLLSKKTSRICMDFLV